jgi:ribosomal protein S12 methylthiotransferase accessory factor
LNVIACDLTTSDIAELGLHAVRIVIPGMHPLHMGHQNRCLGGRRLYDVPRTLGLRRITLRPPDNPHPHPFP